MSGGRLWASFWEAFGDPGVTFSGFCMVPERVWNFVGHRGDQTWMTGSAGTAVDVLVTCDSYNGRRAWEEGGEKSSQVLALWVSAWLSVYFLMVQFSSILFTVFVFLQCL